MRQDFVSLPLPVVKNHISITPEIPLVPNIKCSNQQAVESISEPTPSNTKNNYKYVPYYNRAPKDITHQVDPRIIVEGSRQKKSSQTEDC
ncbi:hypothetical protein O181_013919 [Austropuccinia psidii MF-1]|uniref:Uncharacterized protein n=1 Tax=Austropuccinia psidii MF-1 TaxID=1389203 RepID=A0A9Q3GPC6_9BASI|nr:hypothetical protein [Austropuccinia psidii MF-1]